MLRDTRLAGLVKPHCSVPPTLIDRNAGLFVTQDYTAKELTCAVGQIISGEYETHGWVYCRSEDGSAGWVPRRNLTPIGA
ncbi:SH3 domain-containing protein [Roseinatronobacter monicus]|uniref:SH3 domain-containing protein n=1 Tax=Roseinatronobacter monicus TaxID=393481 RepID=UPI001151718E